jgi:hypothetical protein
MLWVDELPDFEENIIKKVVRIWGAKSCTCKTIYANIYMFICACTNIRKDRCDLEEKDKCPFGTHQKNRIGIS